MSYGKIISAILNCASTAIMVLFMAVALFIYVAPHVGWQVHDVLSGSMAPSLGVGTMVMARERTPENLVTGDVIIFRHDGERNMICHRIIAVETNPLRFETKGDAQAEADPFIVPADDVIAKVEYYLPVAGYEVKFLKTMTGFIMGLIVPAAVIIFLCFSGIRQELLTVLKRKTGETG